MHDKLFEYLSKNLTNISIFCQTLTDEIFEDLRFVQLMNLLISKPDLYNYSYTFYCDVCEIKTNLFIPVFHTSYLGSQTNNVLIKTSEDSWLTEIFRHNKFYILKDHIEDNFDYKAHNINIINHINDLRTL